MKTAEGSAMAKQSMWARIMRWLKIVVVAFVLLFVAGVIWRMPIVAEQDRSAKVAQEIRDSHITMADVDGSHLPPAPDPALVDATVEGVDANHNGIRDDVELAIFNKYPGAENLKIRAAELQYAHALQFYLTSVFTSETLVAAMSQQDRASACFSDARGVPSADAPDQVWGEYLRGNREGADAIKKLVMNVDSRKSLYDKVFANYMTSYGSDTSSPCDVKLPL